MPDDPDRIDLENGVRTMLRTLATDIHVDPPAWHDLIERPAPVLHLPTAGRPAADPAPRPRWHHRPRASVAAAAVVALAVGGALLADRGTADRTTELPSAETITAISPGDPAFDAEAAAAVWSTDLDDPVAAAAAYLAANGIPTAPPLPEAPATVQLVGTDGATATVEWSAATGSGTSGGTIYLRASSAAAQAAVEGWTVVGAAAGDVALEGVRYDGERLEFTVSRTAATGGELALGVWVDGRPVSLGGEAIAQAGAAQVSLGELVDIGADAGAERVLGLPVGADGTVTLRLGQVVDGHVRSLTQMVVVLPEADGATAADIAAAAGGYTGAGASASAEAAGGTGAGGAGASAEGEGGVTVPDAGVPLPGGTDLTVPEDLGVPVLPPLLPELPLPVPSTVSSTLPASPGDVLP
jgi:hypothetical protein